MRLSTGARLTWAAVLAVAVLMPLTGALIAAAYERSAREAFDRRIESYAEALIGLVEVRDGRRLVFPRSPREVRFEQVFSGWYWQFRDAREVLATSRSLWDSSLDYAPLDDGVQQTMLAIAGPRGEHLRGIAMRIRLPELASPVELLVAAPESELQLEVNAFRRLLMVAFGLLGLMLVLVFALPIRWALSPLRRMERSLEDVRSGTAPRVDDRMPPDLRKIADTMNAVLQRQEALMQRARSTAGNLAHALKTPLATMRLHVDGEPPDLAGLRADFAQLQGIVEHHLARAAAAGEAGGLFHRTAFDQAVAPVLDAVRALHRERGIELQVRIAATAELTVDAQDLQELVGNLLDNAMKWARSRVRLEVEREGDRLVLRVDDDGPGIPSGARDQAFTRGARLDERGAGSGLGLAIVRDIAALYRIDFGLSESPDGGLRAELRLPVALPPG